MEWVDRKARFKEDYGEDEKDDVEYVEYEESVDFLMPSVMTLGLLFIGGFFPTEVLWVPCS